VVGARRDSHTALGGTLQIGIIAPPWVPVPPPAYGGTEAFIGDLACELERAGHEVTLFCTGDSTCPVERRSLLRSADPDHIGDIAIERRHVEVAYDVLRGVDVIHDNTRMGPLHALDVRDVPVVVTHHGPFDHSACSDFRVVGPRVDLVAISHHQAATAGDLPIAKVIHHGIDPSRFRFGGGGDYLVFLGRMTPDKGAHRAAALAQQAGVRLLIAGKRREPEEIAYFREHVTPFLGRTIEYVGELDTDAKIDLLAGAKALLNPIQWPEPFGLVMIEAMACGTPVIATDQGAAPEIVQHDTTGFICATDAEIVQRIHDVGALDRRACRQAVEQYFSTQRMTRDYDALFQYLTTLQRV
jgi:glycosyltransferase involved in cell wall biosynthesis